MWKWINAEKDNVYLLHIYSGLFIVVDCIQYAEHINQIIDSYEIHKYIDDPGSTNKYFLKLNAYNIGPCNILWLSHVYHIFYYIYITRISLRWFKDILWMCIHLINDISSVFLT